MILTYLNAQLDFNTEYELFKISKNGFRVEIQVKGESEKRIFKNATEIHNKCDFQGVPQDAIAFESDIRGDGFVLSHNRLESVTITLEE